MQLATVAAFIATATAVSGAATTTTKPAATPNATAPANSSDPNAWHMTRVTSYQARVQGGLPSWDETTKTWVGGFGKTYDEKYRSVLDTVNTASVEGALMYVQAEGINVKEQSVKCERKNKMQYVLFYEISVVQPTPAVAFYDGKHTTLEYCPFAAMDGGKCTESGDALPDTCKQFYGLDGQAKLGPCVGANEQTTDPRAPYPGNYWFSFPNSCPYEKWGPNKTDECRTEYPGGLCPPGVKPDGVKCNFGFKILGYLNLDDLVGITDGTASADGAKFKNYTEFCNAGNVEFSATNTGSGFEVEKSIPFWEKPGDTAANEKRTAQMIEKYNTLAPTATVGKMEPLPADLSAVAAANPKCYLNSKVCATAANGCKRVLYSQICKVCKTAEPGCEKAPEGFKFPDLPVPEGKKPDLGSKSGSVDGSVDGSDSDSGKNTIGGGGSATTKPTTKPDSSSMSTMVSTVAVAVSVALVSSLL